MQANVGESLFLNFPAADPARLGWTKMMDQVKASTSHIYAFVGFNGTADELGLDSNNLVSEPYHQTRL